MAIFCLLLVGCAGTSPQIENKIASLSSSSVVCGDGCSLEFERAEYWLNKHSKLKIQNKTNNTIETYNPYQSKQYGFNISKEPMGDGKYKIHTVVTSRVSIGDTVSTEDVRKMLNHYMRTGEDVAMGVGGSLFSPIR